MIRRLEVAIEGNTCKSITMKLTTKGQVTVPVRIREFLGIGAHSEVDFLIRGQEVLLVTKDHKSSTQSRFAALRGSLPAQLTTADWMRATRDIDDASESSLDVQESDNHER